MRRGRAPFPLVAQALASEGGGGGANAVAAAAGDAGRSSRRLNTIAAREVGVFWVPGPTQDPQLSLFRVLAARYISLKLNELNWFVPSRLDFSSFQ